jgi:hypothetical protein
MNSDVISSFIEPMRQVFELPARCKATTKNPDDLKKAQENLEKWCEPYIRVLHTFDDQTLKQAAENIIAERTKKDFPLPAETNAACKQAFDDIRYNRQRGERPNNRNEDQAFYDKYPDWTELRRQQAYALMRCEMGMEAAEDLWVCALFDFCRVNRRLPDRYEKENVVKVGAKTLDVIGLSGADASILKSMTKLSSQFLRDFFRRHDAICKKIGAEQHLLMAKTNLG